MGRLKDKVVSIAGVAARQVRSRAASMGEERRGRRRHRRMLTAWWQRPLTRSGGTNRYADRASRRQERVSAFEVSGERLSPTARSRAVHLGWALGFYFATDGVSEASW